MVLPGGFQLPVVFCWELAADGDFEDAVLTEPESQGLLREWLRKYLLEQLDAGSVLLGEEFFRDADGCFQEDGTYHCRESIGRVYREQIGEYHGKTS